MVDTDVTVHGDTLLADRLREVEFDIHVALSVGWVVTVDELVSVLLGYNIEVDSLTCCEATEVA